MADTNGKEAVCTICAATPCPGFYTGCLIRDGYGDGRWQCDGKGKLTPAATITAAEQEHSKNG